MLEVDKLLGLYVHIPFCSAICNYCNFNRGLFDQPLKARYVDALVSEISTPVDPESAGRKPADWHGRSADTIYFGGGTPSLLEPEDVSRIIEASRAAFIVATDAEVTLEANPETVTPARLAAYRHAGVNRVSFGAQSFRDDELRRLSRLHDARRIETAFNEARSAGFDNISLDLMMWLPEQRLEHWLESVDRVIELGPDHVSLYLLELYPNAPLKDEMARSAWSQAPDDDAAAMYISGLDRLDANGYEQYEISNVARPARQARHNVKYWTDGAWLGFGCGAHSTEGGRRWKNVTRTEEYIERVRAGVSPSSDVYRETLVEQLGDALFTGLRLTQGVDLDRIQSTYDVDVWERFGVDLQPFLDSALLVREGRRLRLTRRGMLLANEVMSVFV